MCHMWYGKKRKKTHFPSNYFAKPSLAYFRLRTQGSLCFANLMIYIDLLMMHVVVSTLAWMFLSKQYMSNQRPLLGKASGTVSGTASVPLAHTSPLN